MAGDPVWKRRILEAPRVERVEALGEYGVTLKILGSVRATEQWAAGGEFRKRLLAAFAANGIEIPRPQRVVLAQDPNSGRAAHRAGRGPGRGGPSRDDLGSRHGLTVRPRRARRGPCSSCSALYWASASRSTFFESGVDVGLPASVGGLELGDVLEDALRAAPCPRGGPPAAGASGRPPSGARPPPCPWSLKPGVAQRAEPTAPMPTPTRMAPAPIGVAASAMNAPPRPPATAPRRAPGSASLLSVTVSSPPARPWTRWRSP